MIEIKVTRGVGSIFPLTLLLLYGALGQDHCKGEGLPQDLQTNILPLFSNKSRLIHSAWV